MIWNVPIGLAYDALSGEIRIEPDQSVRHALELVFSLFRQLGSGRAVLNYLAREGLELPSQRLHRGIGRVISWQQPRYHVIYQMLTNPMYAGIYAYGRRQEQVDPVEKPRRVLRKAQSEWDAFFPDHHPGYITKQEYEANLAMLENNYNQFPANQGAVREGPTLLQGLIWCRGCGRKMRVRYGNSQPYDICDSDHRKFGTAICSYASSCRVDVLVEEVFLTLMNVNTVELSISYEQQLQEQTGLVDRQWQEKLQRLSYQADLARRRYEAVDPANRLVAATLETEWNARLGEVEAANLAYQAQRPTAHQLSSTLTQIREVVTHLRDYWYQDSVTNQEKKDLLRCVIERVTLEKQAGDKVLRAEICWQGGATSTVEVPKYLYSAPHLFHRMTALARELPDAQIAEALNAEGLETVKGRPWSARRVMDFRLSNGIPSGFTVNAALRLTANGYLTTAEAAARLEINQTTVQKWYKLGLLSGKHAGGQKAWWIEWHAEAEARLGGQARFDPRMTSVKSLCKLQGKTWEQVIRWCVEEGHQIYRLRRGTTFRFYVLPASCFLQP